MTNAPVFWFTGLSGAGKSTIAAAVKQRLEAAGHRVMILDGDDVRTRLNRHLGFSADDIRQNNEIIAGLCAEHRGACDAVLVPIISPFRRSRAAARARLSPGFYEVYIKVDIDIVVRRDVKGLYAKARRGEIENMIGFSPDAPYQPPEAADLVIDTGDGDTATAIDKMYGFIRGRLATADTGGA